MRVVLLFFSLFLPRMYLCWICQGLVVDVGVEDLKACLVGMLLLPGRGSRTSNRCRVPYTLIHRRTAETRYIRISDGVLGCSHLQGTAQRSPPSLYNPMARLTLA